MSLSESSVSPASLRSLLRKLRDADLRNPHIALAGSRRVSIEGCLSLDFPVEQALRYLLRFSDGTEEVLWLAAEGGELGVWTSDEHGQELSARRQVSLTHDRDGRALVPDWRARIDLENAGIRELGHFLRRLVRGVLQAESN